MNFKVSQLKSLSAAEVSVDDLIYIIDSNPTDGSVKSKKVTVGDLIDSRIYGINSSQFVLITGYYANPSWILSLDWSKITNAPSFVTSLSALTDVTISALNSNQLLRYDGVSWKNWTPTYYSLPAGGTTLQYLDGTGALQTFPTSLPTSTVRHQVKAGVPINKGQAVYVTSADGTNMIVGLASNTSEATSSKTMGLLDTTVSTNGFANVVTEGLLAGLDTTGANAAGDPVWLGTNGNLIYGLTNKPYAPAHLVFIGIVTRRNANNGEIFIKPQNGFELEELHNVDARNPSNNDGIFYNSTTQLWEHKQISAVAPTPTLGQVTTAGNTTTNNITIGTLYFGNGNHYLVTDNGSYAMLSSNRTLQLATSGNPVLSVFTSQNVAIGTTTDAGYKLDINGTARVQGATTINNRYLYHQGDSAIQYFMTSNAWSGTNTIFFGDDSSSTIGSISYNHQFDSLSFNVNGSNALFINSSRNVGVGTASPSTVFHVDTSVTAPAVRLSDFYYDYFIGYGGIGTTKNNNYWQIYRNSSQTYYDQSFGGHYFMSNATDLLRILQNGNVLIGTITDAGYKLDVNGTGRFSGNLEVNAGNNGQIFINNVYPRLLFGKTGTPSWSIGADTENSGQFEIGTGAGFPYNTFTSRVYISTAGNVGIGTTAPAYKLDVVGGIRSTYLTTSVVHGEGNTLLLLSGLNGANPGVNEGRLHIGYNQNDPVVRLNSNGVSVNTGTWVFLPQIWFAGGITSSHNIALTIDGMSNGVTSGVASEIVRFTQRGGQFANFYDAGAGLSEFRIWQQVNSNNYIYLKPGQTSYFSTGNLVIGGITDAGYKLDVNGTTRVTSLYTANIYPVSSTVSIWVNSQNSGSRFYFSPVHPDGRINFNAVAGTNDYTLLRTWHDSNQIGLGTGSSAGGGALTTRGDSVLIGTSGALYFMNGTFGPNNVPFRLAISTNATRTSFYSGVENNLTNIESTAFEFTAKSHTFFTGTTAAGQTYPNQFTPLHLSTTGNVIVGGTTDAGYKLDVNGTAVVRSGTLNLVDYYLGISGTCADVNIFNNCGSQGNIGFTLGGNRFFNIWQVTGSSSGNTSGTHSTLSSSPTYAWSSGNAISNHLLLAPTINNTGTYSGIFRGFYYNPTLTSLTGTTHRAIETTSGNVIFNGGNVGIGTSSPIYNLEVSSTGYTGLGLISGANNTAEISFQNRGYGLPRWTIRATGAPDGSSGGLYFQRLASSFDLTIESTGNVLIGTTTDSGYKLDVNGTARINNTLTVTKSGSNNYFNFEPSATGTPPYLQAFYQGAVDARIYFDNSFKFRAGGSSIPFAIDAGAIQGTSLVSAGSAGSQGSLLLLGSSGNTSAVYFWESGVSYRGALGFSGGSADFRIITNLPSPTSFSGNERLRIFGATGNVAIGTTTDNGYKLQVNGNVSLVGAAGGVGLNVDFGNANSNVKILSHGSSDFSQLQIGTNFSLERNGGGDPSITTTFGLGIISNSLSLQTSTASPGKLWLRGNYGLGSAYFGANNSNGTTASTLYFQNSETPTAAQNVVATFNLWGVSDNATAPIIPASSMFSLHSTTRGFLPPRLTTAQILLITSPAEGLQVYNTDLKTICFYNGTAWQRVTSSAM